MSMLQVGVIGVLGVLFAVQFKSGKSEYAVYISVAVSLLLFGCMLERLRDAWIHLAGSGIILRWISVFSEL